MKEGMKEGYKVNECSLYEALNLLETEDEAKRFIKDLCTPKEIREMEERWYIAKLLYDDKLSYRQISDFSKTSTTTVTRVARFLHDEEYQGYKIILDRLMKKEENEAKQ